jgi:tetratricopeptide (TPR) repeat protein
MGIFDWLFGKKKNEEKRPSNIAISETNKVKKKSKKKRGPKPKTKTTDKSTEINAYQKKLTNWSDVDFSLMELSSKYRIKVLKEVMKLEIDDDGYYTFQQDLRIMLIRCKDKCKDVELAETEFLNVWQEITEEYYKTKYTATEKDIKRQTVGRKVKEEIDLVKQNELIDDEIEKDPDNADLHNVKAYNLYKLDKIKEGISEVLKGIKIDPNAAGFYDTAGEGYCMLGEYKKAINIMTKGINIAPDGLSPDGKNWRIEEHYYNRGMAYLKLKEYEKAKKDFLYTLVLDISFEKGMYALQEIPGYASEESN